MGMDCYANVGIGFEVTRDDFIRDEADDLETCPMGHHKTNESAKFCQADGGRFERRVKCVPLHTIWKLANIEAVHVDDPPNLDRWWRDFQNSDFAFQVRPSSGDHGPTVCGVHFGRTESHRMGARPGVSEQATVESLFTKVSGWRHRLGPGFSARPILLYTWLFISV